MQTLGTTALPPIPSVAQSALPSPANTPRKAPVLLPPLSALSLAPSANAENELPNMAAGKERFYASASAVATGIGSTGADTTLTFHRVTPDLALVTLLPTALWDSRRALVEYNVVYFREGVRAVWEAEWKARQRNTGSKG
jgi:Ras-related GTP-binding protein C/D